MFQTIPSMPVLALVMPAVSCMNASLQYPSPRPAFNHECGVAGTPGSASVAAI
jgi:hypothetical protein